MSLKIGHKLLIAILATNVLLAGGLFVLGDWSIGRSFRDYLDRSDAQRLQPLVAALAEEYRQRGDWQWVRDRGDTTWPHLLRRYLQEPPPPRERLPGPRALHQPPADAPPPPARPHGGAFPIDPPLFLADAGHQLILGNPALERQVYWLTITLDEATVGYLGFTRRNQITSDIDRLFRERMRSNLGWVAAGMLLIAMLIALGLARRLVRPIHALRNGANKLASGDYSVALTPQSRDELGELALDFNVLATTLEKNLKARQQWVADISHELRTPVAILQGEIEALRDGVRPWSPRAVESLYQETRRLSLLIHDLHELSLCDLGALSYRMDEVDLLEIIQEVIDHHHGVLEKKSLTAVVRSGLRVVRLHGDAGRLSQLFANLLNNSIFYTDAGGHIEIEVTAGRDKVEVTWSDSTPGVSDSDLPLLFDRLYRAEASRNRNSGGSGLGLAIARNIIEAHHGSVQAHHSPLGGLSLDIQFNTAGSPLRHE